VVETPASVESDAEKFVYRFRSQGGGWWPEALHWERKGTFGTKVDFKFDQPEAGSLSPLKWEAQSQQGEVKVRWRERERT
jgi:hypothetical protein